MNPILLQDTVAPTDSIANTTSFTFKDLAALDWPQVLNSFIASTIDFVFSLIIATLVLAIGKFIIRKIHRLVGKILDRRDAEPSLRSFILSLTNIVLTFLLIVIIIGILGIETSSFLALFASAGVAIGMALSGTLQNFAGGVLILLLKPYKVGDFIEAQGYAGTVTEIQIFHTIINTGDNKSILIPNGALSTGSINNASREDTRRVEWSVSLAYGDNVETARRVIIDMLTKDSRTLMEEGKTPTVALSTLNTSSIDLTVRAWVKSSDFWGLYNDMNERIYNELPNHGLNFPYPHMNVIMTKE